MNKYNLRKILKPNERVHETENFPNLSRSQHEKDMVTNFEDEAQEGTEYPTTQINCKEDMIGQTRRLQDEEIGIDLCEFLYTKIV